MIECSRCHRLLADGEFYTRHGKRHGRQCKLCQQALGKEWRARNQDRYRATRRRINLRMYGLSPEQYEAMLYEQANGCAICKRPPVKYLAVDHHHGTGAVRGLLCQRCNGVLGYMQDSPELLHSAAEYLERAA